MVIPASYSNVSAKALLRHDYPASIIREYVRAHHTVKARPHITPG
jgi:hypothetical protein